MKKLVKPKKEKLNSYSCYASEGCNHNWYFHIVEQIYQCTKCGSVRP